MSNPQPHRSGMGLGFSAVTHIVVLAALVLVPILLPGPVAQAPDYVRALIYNPPPPPPPPLPKGTALVERKERPKPVAPDDQVQPRTLVAEVQVPTDLPLVPEDRDRESEQFGSPTGSDFGVPEGSEMGVEGGVVGGVPGGVLGGVVGGTGDVPVMDPDQGPKPIKIVRPIYPQDAFVKKIEGTVLLEILIDSTGRVSRVRIISSIPALDQAAIETVKQWIFSPAIKRGRPVATTANAPVTFRIY